LTTPTQHDGNKHRELSSGGVPKPEKDHLFGSEQWQEKKRSGKLNLYLSLPHSLMLPQTSEASFLPNFLTLLHLANTPESQRAMETKQTSLKVDDETRSKQLRDGEHTVLVDSVGLPCVVCGRSW